MNDYQPALDQLRERRKGKPGELLLMTGLVAMIVAPFGLFLTNQESGNLSDLKRSGMVAEATVKDRSLENESYTDRKGRTKSREIFKLKLSHDFSAQQKYAAWKAGKPFPVSQYPAVTTREIAVGRSYFDALNAGQKTTIIHNPSDYGSMMLTEEFEYQTSFAYMMWWYLGAGAVFIAGLAMTISGWRKRFSGA
jgi:hypothetical protein